MAAGAPTTSHGTNGGFATGWMMFAAVLMVLSGLLNLLQGIAAIAKDDVFVTTGDYVFRFNLTGWGWVHLLLGIVILLAGIALFTGAVWARVVGVALAGLGLVSNFLWLPYHPFWSIVLIAMDVLVIWALCAAPRSAHR
jgi:hypothetical protein